MDITVLDALIISLIGFAIVLVVLFILMGIVMLMGLASDKGHVITDKLPKFKNPFRKKKGEEVSSEEEESAAVAAPLAVGTCGELTLVRTEERDAAMIMAIVADSLGTPLNELRFKRIERLDDAEVEK
ncbi:MAG: OadG family protein [Christensenellales bacterium]|nr:OadG family protein [Christensenellales bacterium]